MQISYKGETIQFSESMDTWHWANYSNVSLDAVKKYIDRSQKKDFENVSAWRENGTQDGFELVTVTSQAEQHNYWIRDSNGRREKSYNSYLYAATPENTALIKEIEQEQKELEKQEKHVRNLKSKLLPLSKSLKPSKRTA